MHQLLQDAGDDISNDSVIVSDEDNDLQVSGHQGSVLHSNVHTGQNIPDSMPSNWDTILVADFSNQTHLLSS
jgi:hypothetical protein